MNADAQRFGAMRTISSGSEPHAKRPSRVDRAMRCDGSCMDLSGVALDLIANPDTERGFVQRSGKREDMRHGNPVRNRRCRQETQRKTLERNTA